jgi:hypothetical protein
MTYDNPDLEFLLDDERERCATLVATLASIYEVKAKRKQKPARDDYYLRGVAETEIKDHEEAARYLRVLERSIRNGYDPRESERELLQNEKIRLMQEPRTDDQLAFLRLAIEEAEPLPRCIHGNCVRDGSGEALEPSCGCRADPR